MLSFFTISVKNRYRNLYRPIPITIRHFPYRQNQYIGRYRNCIGRTLIIIIIFNILISRKSLLIFRRFMDSLANSILWTIFLKSTEETKARKMRICLLVWLLKQVQYFNFYWTWILTHSRYVYMYSSSIFRNKKLMLNLML